MALIGNASLLHKSPAKYVTGTVGFCDRANWNKPGMMRSRGDLTVSTLWKYDAVPSGTYAGSAFFPPKQAGRMVTRSAFTVDASAVGAMGLPGAATSSFAVNASAIGGLFAGGVASCTITVSASGSIAGLAAGQAAASIAVNASAVTGGIAWGVATGAFSVSATAQGYGLGYMQASTVDNTALTPASITQAVWNAVAAEYTDSGTMGAKLNTASSGGVDLNALAQAVWEYATRTLTAGAAPTAADVATAVLAAAQATPIHADARAMNGATITGNGTSGDLWRGA